MKMYLIRCLFKFLNSQVFKRDYTNPLAMEKIYIEEPIHRINRDGALDK